MSVRNKRDTQTIRRARLAVTCVFVAAILLTPGAARASVQWTVCASGCNFTSITDAVTQSNPDDLIEVMPDLKLGPTPNPNNARVLTPERHLQMLRLAQSRGVNWGADRRRRGFQLYGFRSGVEPLA